MIYTIGHSTRTIDDFMALLRAHGIAQVVDIRTIPRSRRHPHFSREALAGALAAAGMAYRHMPALGGLRKPRRESTNGAWRNESFRGYADYMRTPAFRQAVDELVEASTGQGPVTAVMCAEAVWWRCHRQLVADALVARGITVRHIASASAAPIHTLTEFAKVDGDLVSYPALV